MAIIRSERVGCSISMKANLQSGTIYRSNMAQYFRLEAEQVRPFYFIVSFVVSFEADYV